MKKLLKFLLLFSLLLGTLGGLSACGDEYADGSVRVPSNWASYQLGPLQYRFMAGWETADWQSLSIAVQAADRALSFGSKLTFLGHFSSPRQALGTVNTLSIGYYYTPHPVSATDLEALMPELDNLDDLMDQQGIITHYLQKSRIRLYNGNPALTLAFKLEQDEIVSALQIAFIPSGNRIYQLVYADFTTAEDDNTMERLLSSLVMKTY